MRYDVGCTSISNKLVQVARRTRDHHGSEADDNEHTRPRFRSDSSFDRLLADIERCGHPRGVRDVRRALAKSEEQ
jgi:hypothetical protein